MNIICIGDVHAHTKQYQKLIRQRYQDCRTVQLGDMGIGFKGAGLHQMPASHGWIRGNHDNPTKCQTTHNYLGDWGVIPNPNGQNGMFIGGGFSIDRAWRHPGVDWWPDEELSYEKLDEVIKAYQDLKPAFVLSHECPARAGRAMLDQLIDNPYYLAKMECTRSRTAEAMQQMFELHQPKEWVFGHYHLDTSFKVQGAETKFTCVAPMHAYELMI